MVETVTVQVQVPKEGKEIVDAVAGLLGHFLDMIMDLLQVLTQSNEF